MSWREGRCSASVVENFSIPRGRASQCRDELQFVPRIGLLPESKQVAAAMNLANSRGYSSSCGCARLTFFTRSLMTPQDHLRAIFRIHFALAFALAFGFLRSVSRSRSHSSQIRIRSHLLFGFACAFAFAFAALFFDFPTFSPAFSAFAFAFVFALALVFVSLLGRGRVGSFAQRFMN